MNWKLKNQNGQFGKPENKLLKGERGKREWNSTKMLNSETSL